MRNKLLLFCLFALLIVGVTTNSCKKGNQNYLKTLLTDKHWQLASLTVTQTRNDTTLLNDTINPLCNLVQSLTFNSGGTCTYTNFDCISQTVNGHWLLTANNLYLVSDLKFQDTTAIVNPTPFTNAQILNLGQYSLVLKTGDLGIYHPPNTVLTVFTYGFVRVKNPQ
ncbi:MAG: hypothetical protein ACXVIY_05135 [Mucilaginibacter sp.]